MIKIGNHVLKLYGGTICKVQLNFIMEQKSSKPLELVFLILGDLIVPDVGIRTSVVGLGTTFPANPEVIVQLNEQHKDL